MLRKLLAILLMLCLPLQVQAAMLMPLSQQAMDSAAAERQQAGHCQHDAGDQSSPADGCDRCSLCHLVVAMPLTPDLLAMPALRDYAQPAGARHRSFIPDAPQEPPRGA